jgi:hypothetical protein
MVKKPVHCMSLVCHTRAVKGKGFQEPVAFAGFYAMLHGGVFPRRPGIWYAVLFHGYGKITGKYGFDGSAFS